MTTNRRARRAAIVLIACAAFVVSAWYVVATFDWSASLQVLRGTRAEWLVLGAAAIIVYWFLRAARWRMLLAHLGLQIPFAQLYVVTAIAVGFSIVTPFQAGEALKVELFKMDGKLERSIGYATFLVERAADLSVVLFLALAGTLLGTRLELGPRGLLIALSLFALGTLLAIVIVWKVTWPTRLEPLQKDIQRCLRGRATLLVVVGLTLLGWAVTAVGWHACLLALGIDLGYLQVLSLMAVVTTLGVFGLIPGAVGVAEASIAFLLLNLGRQADEAQAAAILLRGFGLMTLALASVHLGLYKLLLRP